jgi:hypothetical protein
MRRLLAFAVLLACAQPALAQAPPPAIWSGEASMVAVGAPVLFGGDAGPGEVLYRSTHAPSRVARLVEPYVSTGQDAFTIPAGTLFFASLHAWIPVAGAPPAPPRRANDIHWCTAEPLKPRACFRWNGPGDTEVGPMWGGMPLDAAPIDAFRPAPEPRLVEIDTHDLKVETIISVVSLDERGLALTYRTAQGADASEQRRTLRWNELAYAAGGRFFTPEPVRGADGQISAARLVWKAPPG